MAPARFIAGSYALLQAIDGRHGLLYDLGPRPSSLACTMSGGIDLLLGKNSFSARSGSSLSSFQHYKDTERELRRLNSRGDSSSGFTGPAFPEFETLSLRIDPPTVTVAEREDGRATVVEIESANRAGTLCEVGRRAHLATPPFCVPP